MCRLQCRLRSCTAVLIDEVAKLVPARVAHLRMQPLAVEAGLPQLERRGGFSIGQHTTKAAFHQCPQRGAFPGCELTRFTQEAVVDFDCCLQSTLIGGTIWAERYGLNDMGTYRTPVCHPGTRARPRWTANVQSRTERFAQRSPKGSPFPPSALPVIMRRPRSEPGRSP